MGKMIKSGIYKITNRVNNKIYIGSSVDIKRRWYSHTKELKKQKAKNKFLQNTWNKYGEENFVFEVIELIEDKTNLIEREQYYLDLFRSYKRTIGFNISPTAGSTLGYKHTKSAKEKVSQSNIGKTYSDEVNKKKGRPGSIVSIKTKLKISKALKGNKKLVGRITYTKPVLQYDLNRNLIKKWDSGKIASKELKISFSGISLCCNNKIKTFKKYLWEFEFGDKKITSTNKKQ